MGLEDGLKERPTVSYVSARVRWSLIASMLREKDIDAGSLFFKIADKGKLYDEVFGGQRVRYDRTLDYMERFGMIKKYNGDDCLAHYGLTFKGRHCSSLNS